MNFNNMGYLPFIIVTFVIFSFLVLFLEKRFFKLIKTFWFFNRSLFSYISSFLFLAGMGVLLLSLLDARGPEQKIKTPVPTERTIILLDTSASMLAEDVKPSRLQKAALVAKHFARKAPGHQISIVAFAEISKKIVPFTNDLDLIDARLDSLKNLRNHYGSSALSIAIQESMQYFLEAGGEMRGNILVLTDGEETAEGINFKVPKEIRIAMVGVGSTQGGRIPLDDGRGFRYGYKKDKGKDVITKLNENFFKKAVADIPTAKYWLANSYTLPTEEIVDFFKSESDKGKDQQDMIVKPVMMEWIVIPALGLIILSYFFKAIRVFSLGLLLIIAPLHAQEKKEEVTLSPEVTEKLGRLQEGQLSKPEKVKLADDLYRAGSKAEAIEIYEENLGLPKIDKSIPPEAYLNYGTSLLEKNESQKGLSVYQELSKNLGKDEASKKIRETMDKNVVSYFLKQEEQKKKEEKEKKDKKENKDQDKKDQKDKDQQNGGQGEPKPDQGQGKDQKDPKDSKDDQGQEKKKKEEEEKKKESEEGKDKEKNEPPKPEEGEGEEKKPLPPQKLPAKLKQLMSDDRQLQMQMIERGTKDLNKRKSSKSKDW